jgi:Fe-S-cluster containining protein
MGKGMLPVNEFDCLNFPSRGRRCVACCQYGVHVTPSERAAILAAGLGVEGDFTGPDIFEGDWLYRSEVTDRGCVFLGDGGCRLHGPGHKPEVCRMVPRSESEAIEMYEDGYLPCYPYRRFAAELVR